MARLPKAVSAILILATVVPFKGSESVNIPSPRLQLKDFLIQSASLVTASGEVISLLDYTPENWYPVTVPSTVLHGLVGNGVYPDPYVGLNNMQIPDASDEFNQKFNLARFSHLPNGKNPWEDPYWFRAEFEWPAQPGPRRTWLTFNGINYRADVWLNGTRIGDSREIVGMFERFTFDITTTIVQGGKNVLLVKIHPVDFPGVPADPQLEVLGPFGPNGGLTGEIGKNVTMQSSVGWDWIPAVRDRNMGIWQEVFVSSTGPVEIRNPRIVTDLSLPQLDSAGLTVEAEVANHSSEPFTGLLKIRISPGNFEGPTVDLQDTVQLEPGQSKKLLLDPGRFPKLLLQAPRLWWPSLYGRPDLYLARLTIESTAGVSDEELVRFGIREVDSEVTVIDGWARRDFRVNGKQIEIRGGAWVPDMMLNRDRARYARELRLSRDANFNMVRIWGGGVTPPDAFFEACDELGLLVWHDFWITGDCQGTFGKGTRDWPLEGDVFLSNARDTVLRLRNHPSLLVWTAGNEGYPRKELYQALRNDIVAGLDGTRPFLPTSGYANPDKSWGLSWPDNHESGAYSGGPYRWVDPVEYYRLVDAGKDWLFKDEVGLPSLPPVEMLKRFIPDLTPDPAKPFPLNNTWGYHDAAEDNGKYSLYDQAIRDRYGEPTSLENYVLRGQLVNAENYRAIFEAVNHGLDRTAGVILWKTNPAWPSVIWQVYDWYLRPNAGYYFAKRACEPLHVQLSLDDRMVAVVNLGYEGRSGLSVEAKVLDAEMNLLLSRSAPVDAGPASVRELFELEIPGYSSGEIRFVHLALKGSEGQLVSEDLYWLASGSRFTQLFELPMVQLEARAVRETQGEELNISLELRNPGKTLAFFLNPTLRLPDGEEVLPTFWSDNYVSLLPGASRQLSARVLTTDLGGQSPSIQLEGLNVAPLQVQFTSPSRRRR